MQPNWRPGSDQIERNCSRFIAEAVRHKRNGRRRIMALWEWLRGAIEANPPVRRPRYPREY
jgi:hypothetical protein